MNLDDGHLRHGGSRCLQTSKSGSTSTITTPHADVTTTTAAEHLITLL